MGIYFFFNVHQYKVHRNSSQLVLHAAFSLKFVGNCFQFFHTSIFFFRCILSNINTIFTFCTSFTCTKSWQIFPTVTYFQTCSMRWNTQRHILSCTSIGRNLGDDGNSTALPTPCSKGGQRDGEVVCLALGFFSPQTDFYRVFLSKHLLAALASEGRTFPAAWWLQQCWQVGSGLSLAVWALLSIPSLEGFDAPTTVVP